MKLALVVALCGVAAADPHKPLPDKFTASAAKVFDKAVVAERAGHWADAISLYQQAFELAPHPNAIFNVAAVEAEHGDLERALVAYQIYLELAPAAPDHAQVEARIAQLLAAKQTTTMRVGRELALEDAYVLVDGAIIARPGQIHDRTLKLTATRGRHWVAVVTPISYGAAPFGARGELLDARNEVVVQAQTRADGNLLTVLDYEYSAELERKSVGHEGTRLMASPGMHWLKVRDHKHECPPVKLDLPPGEDVQFVFITPTEDLDVEPRGCRAFTPKLDRLVFKTK